MITYGVFNPQSFVAPSAPITIYGVDHTIKYLRVLNNSPFQLAINFGGQIVNMSEFWQKDIALADYFQGTLKIIPSIAILSSSHAQAYQLTVQGLVDADNGGGLDSAIPQQAVTATASGSPIFTATWEVRSTAGVNQNLAVFLPSNSGVIAEFHSAKVSTNDATLPTSNAIYWNADPNLPNAVNAVTHSGWNPTTNSGIATSVMHCTADDDSTSFFFANRATDIEDIPQNVTRDLLAFPDKVTLNPGVALILTLYSGTTGHTIRLTLKWAEITVVPPITVLGPGMIANVLQNDGNPVGTSIIESTVSGGLQPVHLFNDGTGFYAVDQSGTLHRVFTFNSAGNPLQLGQAGDILELLGQGLIDQLLTAVLGLVVNGATNPTIDISGATGATGIKLQGGFNISGKHPAQLVGGTSGTADLFQICDGNFKIYGLQTNNFRTGGSNQQIVFPTAFTTVAMFIAHDLEPTQLMAGATVPGLRQWSAFSNIAGTANSTVAAAQPINYPNIVWGGGAFDRIQFNSGWTLAHTAVGLLFGF